MRDIWSPVQIDTPVLDEKFSGALMVHNRYDFTSLAQCRLMWMLQRYPDPAAKDTIPQSVASGVITPPAIAPHSDGTVLLPLPSNWRDADSLTVIAAGPDAGTLWTWVWPTATLAHRLAANGTAAAVSAIEQGAAQIELRAGNVSVSIDSATGLLREVKRGGRTFALTNGPRLAFARPPTAGPTEWLPFADSVGDTRKLVTPGMASVVEVEVDNLRGGASYANLKLELSPDGTKWKTVFDSSRRPGDGARYEFPPQMVAAIRLSNVHRYDGQSPVLKTFRVGYAPTRFPAMVVSAAVVTKGDAIDVRGGASGLDRMRWALRDDGSLQLDYSYELSGDFAYHGITFDHATEKIETHRWLGEGPYRVWQNRLRGTWLGVHETARHEQQAGEAWVYPEFEGYFAGVRWTRLATTAGSITVSGMRADTFVRIGTPRIDHPSTTIDFPAGDISFLHAIPAIGSKGKPAEQAGPHSQWAKAAGRYEGTLVFRFGD